VCGIALLRSRSICLRRHHYQKMASLQRRRGLRNIDPIRSHDVFACAGLMRCSYASAAPNNWGKQQC
jgi:hypothetical protein